MIEIKLNGERHSMADAQSLAALLKNLDLARRRVAVIRNGDVIHREEYASTLLAAGDSVDIVQMVGGG